MHRFPEHPFGVPGLVRVADLAATVSAGQCDEVVTNPTLTGVALDVHVVDKGPRVAGLVAHEAENRVGVVGPGGNGDLSTALEQIDDGLFDNPGQAPPRVGACELRARERANPALEDEAYLFPIGFV